MIFFFKPFYFFLFAFKFFWKPLDQKLPKRVQLWTATLTPFSFVFFFLRMNQNLWLAFITSIGGACFQAAENNGISYYENYMERLELFYKLTSRIFVFIFTDFTFRTACFTIVLFWNYCDFYDDFALNLVNKFNFFYRKTKYLSNNYQKFI